MKVGWAAHIKERRERHDPRPSVCSAGPTGRDAMSGTYMFVEPHPSDRCLTRVTGRRRCQGKVVKVVGHSGNELWRWPMCEQCARVLLDEEGA